MAKMEKAFGAFRIRVRDDREVSTPTGRGSATKSKPMKGGKSDRATSQACQGDEYFPTHGYYLAFFGRNCQELGVRNCVKMMIFLMGACIVACNSLLSANQVAFFYALDADLEALKNELGAEGTSIKIEDRVVSLIKTGEISVVASAMRPGPVESAVTVSTVLSRYPCRLVLSVGPAGGLGAEPAVGTWGLVSSVVPYQKIGTDGGGEDSGRIELSTYGPLPEIEGDGDLEVPVDLPSWTAASGERFIADRSVRDELRRVTGAEVVEMNLFGVDAALRSRAMPAVHLRVVSDLADETARADFPGFIERYKGSGGRWCARIIKALPPDPHSPVTYPGLRDLIESVSGPEVE